MLPPKEGPISTQGHGPPQLKRFLNILMKQGDEGFPGGSVGKESACNAGDTGSIPGSGRCPGGGNGHPLQYACLENPMDRGAWWATGHGVAESDTTECSLSMKY